MVNAPLTNPIQSATLYRTLCGLQPCAARGRPAPRQLPPPSTPLPPTRNVRGSVGRLERIVASDYAFLILLQLLEHRRDLLSVHRVEHIVSDFLGAVMHLLDLCGGEQVLVIVAEVAPCRRRLSLGLHDNQGRLGQEPGGGGLCCKATFSASIRRASAGESATAVTAAACRSCE